MCIHPKSLAYLIYLMDRPDPPPEIIRVARSVLTQYPRDELPDWVEIIANGNPQHLTDVIQLARDEIANELIDRSTQTLD
jgi:hypothetical protein